MTPASRVGFASLLLLAGACDYDWTVPEGSGGGPAQTGGATAVGGGGTGQGGAGEGGVGGQPGSGGQGGGAGGIGPCTHVDGESACATCAKDNCCPELQACDLDAHCQCARECVENAAVVAVCLATCVTSVGPVSPTSRTLNECNQMANCGCVFNF